MTELKEPLMCRCGVWIVAYERVDEKTIRHRQKDGEMSQCTLEPQAYELPKSTLLFADSVADMCDQEGIPRPKATGPMKPREKRARWWGCRR